MPSLKQNESATKQVELYGIGVIFCSACASADMTQEQVEDAVNRQHPTGIQSRWRIASENFWQGNTNPCECDQSPERKHWLLSC